MTTQQPTYPEEQQLLKNRLVALALRVLGKFSPDSFIKFCAYRCLNSVALSVLWKRWRRKELTYLL